MEWSHRTSRFVFFLGGGDLEMATIRVLLEDTVPGRVHDKGLTWGAKASAYRKEIHEALQRGMVPVLVELEDDLRLAPNRIVVVDHHGNRAGADRPTSLHQVFHLLDLPPERWTRWYDLVAANDRGHIAEMAEIGATRVEIVQVRAADRAAQGITAEQERSGKVAVAQAETVAQGRLTVIRLPHSRNAVATDHMDPALGGPGFENLLVISPEEVNFYGEGSAITALSARFPGGWWGGALPQRGFWGRLGASEDVKSFLTQILSNSPEHAACGPRE